MEWNGAAIEQKLEYFKNKKPGQEFFLIFDGEAWCAGYMNTPGIVPEMDVTLEVSGQTIDEALKALELELIFT